MKEKYLYLRELALLFFLITFLTACGSGGGGGGGSSSSPEVGTNVTIKSLEDEEGDPELISDISRQSDDEIMVTFMAYPKNPDLKAADITSYYNVTLTSYTMEFIKTDGSLLYSDTGHRMNVYLDLFTAGQNGNRSVTSDEVNITLVKATKKETNPLNTITKLTETTAKITFKGQDTNGNEVKTTGEMTVYFTP